MEPLESLQQQLRQTAAMVRARRAADFPPLKYCGIDDLVLRKGRVYPRSSQRPPVAPIAKACFAQSYRIATRARVRWVYVEGYALSSATAGLAVHHAWVTSIHNPTEAVDLAWTNPDAVYLGIPLRADFVRRTFEASDRRTYGALDAWWQKHPLLTGDVAIEDVMWP